MVPRGTDTVPAMLTPGEYVIPAPVVAKLGPGYFDQLIKGKLKPPPIEADLRIETGDALEGTPRGRG